MPIKIFYVAAFAKPSDHAWFSLGRMRKVGQIVSTIGSLAHHIQYLNIAPFHQGSIEIGTPPISVRRMCSTSFLPLRIIQLIANSAFFFLAIKNWSSPSILWLYNTRYAESSVALAALIVRPQLRLVLQLEDLASARDDNHGWAGIIDRFTTSLLSRRANRVFAVSEDVAQAFSNENQFDYDSIEILPPTLDPIFSRLAAERIEPFSSPRYTILYAGSYHREKGAYDLIEAFLSLGTANAQLILAGSAPEHTIASFKSESQISFTGVLNNEALYRLYSTCDVVVNPHRKILNANYIFPFKLIETVSSGALPLTTPVPGSEKLGLPADCFIKDIQDLSEKLSRAPELWRNNRESVQTAASICRQRYSSEAMTHKIKSTLSSL